MIAKRVSHFVILKRVDLPKSSGFTLSWAGSKERFMVGTSEVILDSKFLTSSKDPTNSSIFLH